MAALRVFISHASVDSAFAERLATDLRNAGSDVWLDSSHLTGPGDFVARISQALNERDVLVLILSPAAIASQWVPDEMNAAIVRAKQGYMRPPFVVQCADVPLRDIPGLWTTYQRVEMMRDYGSALPRVFVALGLTSPAPAYTPPTLPPVSGVSPITPDGPLKATPLPNRPSLSPSKPVSTVSPLRVGLLIGVVLAAILVVVDLLSFTNFFNFLPTYIGSFVISDVIDFTTIVVFAFVGGYRTFTKSGRILHSLLAGILIGFIGMLLDFNLDGLIDAVALHVGFNDLFYAVVMLRYTGLAIVFGLAFGALGGLVGRWRAAAH